MAEREADVPDDRRIAYRVGINTGDVVIDGDDILGDGVNIAARLEAIAAPGGVCVSGTVHEHVVGKLDLDFDDMGEQKVKNIQRPVRAWAWAASGNVVGVRSHTQLATSKKPSLAVLPFDDLSNNPENDALADGLTEDLTTALSRTRWFDVAARNSTFAYKGQSPNVREVARSLGVRYVLEGSVRTAGGQARITAQLIDAETGNHVWADRYDRKLEDIFSLQDEIAGRIASLLAERVWQDVAKKINRLPPEDYGAYEHTLAGASLLHRLTPAAVRDSERHLETAIQMDSTLPLTHICLGLAYLAEWLFWGDPDRDLLADANRCAAIAQQIAPDDAMVYRLQFRLSLAMGAFDAARRESERAVKINPSDGDILIAKANYETCAGDAAIGLRLFEQVIAVHSETPHSADIARMWMAINLLVQDDPERALTTLREISGLNYLKNLLLSATFAAIGNQGSAKASLTAARSEVPDVTISRIGMLRCFRRPEDGRKLQDAFQLAGLPAD
jgi:TolB-like protein